MSGKSKQQVIVVGGGFAGLSAATALADRGFKVTVLEGRQVLGGRAYSFTDPKTGDSVDNGQHLFMGCYRETQKFLSRIGSLDQLKFQANLSVDFVGDNGRRAFLRGWPLPAPLHLLSGLMRLSTLSWGDRFRLLKMRRAIREALAHPERVEPLTVEQWLTQAGQSESARRHLWDLIAIAALNEDPAIASAAPFATVLAQAFFDGRRASQLGIARVGLSDLYVREAQQFIEDRGGQVRMQSPVAQIDFCGDHVDGVILRNGTKIHADAVVSAVPPSAFLRLVPEVVREKDRAFQNVANLRYAPIISIQLWFDREISRLEFAGLLDTHVQWFFNKSRIHRNPKSERGYVSLVISGAHAFVGWDDKRLLTLAVEELHRLFPKTRSAVLTRSLVIKEYHATLSPVPGTEAMRPSAETPYKNFWIAGDWTRTGLPATIEGACLSGHRCADLVCAALPPSVSAPAGGGTLLRFFGKSKSGSETVHA